MPTSRRTAGYATNNLAALALLTALAAPAQAVTLRIVDATLEVGGAPQMVTFAVDDATGVEGFELALSYDPAVVRIAGAVRRTAIAEGCLLVDNPNEPGTLRIALACLSPLEGAGGVLTIPLAARAPGTSPFVITYCRVNEQVSEGHPVGVVTVLDRDALATTVASPRSPDH